MRNVTKQAAAGKKILDGNSRYEMNYAELKQLLDQVRTGQDQFDADFDLVCNSFRFGVAVGYRVALKERGDNGKIPVSEGI